jgi:hypothetical protein
VGIALDLSAGKMYWADPVPDKVQRSNLNGSGVEDLLALDAGAIALDTDAGKMYLIVTDSGRTAEPDGILRANLDGSDLEELVTTGLDTPTEIALDIAAGKMYWTDPAISSAADAKIQRANLDGTDVEDLITASVTPSLGSPRGIALHLGSGKMYWTNFLEGKIQRADLDGSDGEDVLTAGLFFPYGIALDLRGSGDSDGDGDIDLFDFGGLVDCLSGPNGGLAPGCEAFDFNADADIDLADYGSFQAAFTGP